MIFEIHNFCTAEWAAERRLIKMDEYLRHLWTRYRRFISYMIVGGLTTVINFAVYYLPGLDLTNILIRNTVSWLISVIFSFFANRRFVFHSMASTVRAKLGEFVGFVGSRFASLIAEDLIIALCALCGLSNDIAKIPATVIVVILNYITGHIVFRGRDAVRGRVRELLHIKEHR